MKAKQTILTIALAVVSISLFAQKNAHIVGEWYNAEKDAVITLFEDGRTISGKITWMKFENDENGRLKTDHLNPNKSLRSRSRIGMLIMNGFSYDEDNVWEDGELYDPKKGKTYSGILTLKDANTLDLRGYIGFSFIGRSSTWTRKLD